MTHEQRITDTLEKVAAKDDAEEGVQSAAQTEEVASEQSESESSSESYSPSESYSSDSESSYSS